MPYFVDGTNGLDTNNGTSATTAFKTIARAIGAQGVTGIMPSGETLYIRPGIYRAGLVPTNVNTSETKIIGDVDGTHFGVAGNVIITPHTNDYVFLDAIALTINGRSNYTFENLIFTSGSGNTGLNIIGGSSYLKFKKCVFEFQTTTGFVLNTTLTNANIFIDSCVFATRQAAIDFYQIPSLSNDYVTGLIVQNCLFLGAGFTRRSVTSVGRAGGEIFINNTFYRSSINSSTSSSTLYKTKLYNNLMLVSGTAFNFTTNSAEGDYNRFVASTTNFTAGNYTSGGNDLSVSSPAVDLFGSLLNRTVNRSAFMPIYSRSAGTSTVSGLTIPTYDMLGNTRPNPPTIGCLEESSAFPLPTHKSIIGETRGWNSKRQEL